MDQKSDSDLLWNILRPWLQQTNGKPEKCQKSKPSRQHCAPQHSFILGFESPTFQLSKKIQEFFPRSDVPEWNQASIMWWFSKSKARANFDCSRQLDFGQYLGIRNFSVFTESNIKSSSLAADNVAGNSCVDHDGTIVVWSPLQFLLVEVFGIVWLLPLKPFTGDEVD